MELKIEPDSLFLAAYFLSPGVLILTARLYFSGERLSSLAELAWRYASLSLVYLALTLPVAAKVVIKGSSFSIWLWYLFALILPLILGALYGVLAQNDSIYVFLNKINVRLTHRIPTAWEWKFSNLSGSYAIITLDDDTRFAGFLGRHSFISSDSSARDIYVERTYMETNEGWVEPDRRTGVLIGANRIKSVEFIEDKKNG